MFEEVSRVVGERVFIEVLYCLDYVYNLCVMKVCFFEVIFVVGVSSGFFFEGSCVNYYGDSFVSVEVGVVVSVCEVVEGFFSFGEMVVMDELLGRFGVVVDVDEEW